MIVKEFLPNPVGKDAGGEYVTLFNDGDAVSSLSGWKLKDASGKIFSLNGYRLEPGKELKLFSSVTKLSLNNNGETIQLIDVSGTMASELSYVGSAQEGRVIYANREITPELRQQLFDPLAAQAINLKQSLSGEMIATGLVSAFVLAIISLVILNKVHNHKSEIEQLSHVQTNVPKKSNTGWPA